MTLTDQPTNERPMIWMRTYPEDAFPGGTRAEVSVEKVAQGYWVVVPWHQRNLPASQQTRRAVPPCDVYTQEEIAQRDRGACAS